VGGEHRLDAGLVDPHALAHGGELLLALHGPREIEGLVEWNDLRRTLGERAVVAHRHHVVEPVDAETLPAALARPVGDPLPGVLGEDLVLDPGLAVIADPARLAREDDRRFAFGRQDDVRVAVEDPETGHVPDRALEARVLRAGAYDRVDALLLGRLAHRGVAPLDLGHPNSFPLISAVSARLSGASTP